MECLVRNIQNYLLNQINIWLDNSLSCQNLTACFQVSNYF